MEYKDIKTADELESWYAEKENILEGHVRDYAVPFGNVYHLDSPGYSNVVVRWYYVKRAGEWSNSQTLANLMSAYI